MQPASPPVLDGIAALVPDYDLLLCDVWGVVHNGRAAYPGAVDALARAREAGASVVLVSNAPRPGPVVVRQMAQLGVPAGCYDAIVTSGDVTRDELAARPGAKIFHLGPERDLPNYGGLDLSLADFTAAELVVCTGLFDDTKETPADYADLLARMRARNLLMLCANPDLVVERGDQHVWCAGALAEDYRKLGGEVLYAGKPYPAVYRTALARASALRGAPVASRRVLAIGDGVRTDLLGAVRENFDCLFVAGGIHAADLDLGEGREPGAADYANVFAAAGAWPAALIRRLVW